MIARFGWFAEIERDLLAEGTQAGLQAAKGQGPFALGHS
jgi:DNA invertase Pin-like site-specific DNA recombinase